MKKIDRVAYTVLIPMIVLNEEISFIDG